MPRVPSGVTEERGRRGAERGVKSRERWVLLSLKRGKKE
jgi:hypothetical protein